MNELEVKDKEPRVFVELQELLAAIEVLHDTIERHADRLNPVLEEPNPVTGGDEEKCRDNCSHVAELIKVAKLKIRDCSDRVQSLTGRLEI